MSLSDLGRLLVQKRFGDATSDIILRVTGLLALLAVPLALYEPHSAVLTGFVLVTIWMNGPYSPVLPATFEPMLMLMGRLYPPLLVATLGTFGTLTVEYLNYKLYQSMLFSRKLSSLREGRVTRKVVRLFSRRPFFTVWVCSWSPLPYWIVRILSPLAGYKIDRHLFATLLGRFPRLWFFAALGLYLRVSIAVLFLVSLVSIAIGVSAWSVKSRDLARASEGPPSAKRLPVHRNSHVGASQGASATSDQQTERRDWQKRPRRQSHPLSALGSRSRENPE